jgi:hypothetical protein
MVARSVLCLTTDWTTVVRCAAEARYFSYRLCVQSSSDTDPSSCGLNTGDRFAGLKHGRGVKQTTDRSYICLPCCLHGARMSGFYVLQNLVS